MLEHKALTERGDALDIYTVQTLKGQYYLSNQTPSFMLTPCKSTLTG
jgi:hypothetical protein